MDDTREWQDFDPASHEWQQFYIGVYLITVGVLGTLINGLVLTALMKFHSVDVLSRSLLVNLCITDLGICVPGLLFSGPSSIANRWLFSDAGCQGYAFVGFLFGSAGIGTLMMLSVNRYRSYLCLQHLTKKTDERTYDHSNLKIVLAVWVYALFWSLAPLMGWARYNYEPSMTTCTIDWRHNDTSYKSFIAMYFFFGFVLPLMAMVVCYSRATHTAKQIFTLIILLIVVFVIAWSGYAVLCLWTVFTSALSVPYELTLIPPLLAKASTVVNPLLYIMMNQPICRASRAAVACYLPRLGMPPSEPKRA